MSEYDALFRDPEHAALYYIIIEHDKKYDKRIKWLERSAWAMPPALITAVISLIRGL